jgi:voltage-gated potassium channel
MITGLVALTIVFVVAIVGFMIAGWRPSDAVYMVVITTFGVGYGEVRPIVSAPLRALTIVVIIAGYGALIYTGGGFIQLLVDGELNRALGARRMTKDIDQLSDHTIVCGFGRMGTTLARELHAAGRPFVAIDTLGGTSPLAEDNGYLVIAGDATEERTLQRAGIERARVLATVTADDATNVFVTLTARQMNPDLTIIARGEHRGTENKLRICGADTVVMTTSIGASKISQLIMRPTADELLDRLTRSTDSGADLDQIGLEFDELLIGSDSPLVDKSLGEIEVRGAHGYLIVGIRRSDGSTTMHPPASTEVHVGDVVVVLGYRDDIPELAARLSSSSPTESPRVTYRGVSS